MPPNKYSHTYQDNFYTPHNIFFLEKSCKYLYRDNEYRKTFYYIYNFSYFCPTRAFYYLFRKHTHK